MTNTKLVIAPKEKAQMYFQKVMALSRNILSEPYMLYLGFDLVMIRIGESAHKTRGGMYNKINLMIKKLEGQ